MDASAIVSLGGFLLTSDEWEDGDLRLALLSAWAERASVSADHECYESFEVLIEA